MTDAVASVVAILAAAVGAYAAWHTATGRTFSNPLFYAVAILEVALLGVLVGGCLALATTDRDVDGVLFVSYLVTLVVIPPAAVLWGIAEKSRWGTGVVTVALLTVGVLCVRTLQIWEGTNV